MEYDLYVGEIMRNISRSRRVALGMFSFVVIFVSVALLIGGVGVVFYIGDNYDRNIDMTLFAASARGGATKIFYYDMEDRMTRTGDPVELINERLEGNNCIYVNFWAVPQDLIDAFVAIEDKRFWNHSGVDWKRTVSAVFNYFKKDGASFGGSTITQQLVKNITGNRQYSKERKIQEIIWAQKLETRLSKNEILELYLNVINLAHGCTGVQAAANYYFSKDVSELNLVECAAIAAITNNPSYYDPINKPENNMQRRNLILDQMLEQKYISREEHDAAYNAALVLDTSWADNSNHINSWYTDMVIEDVINDLCMQYGYSSAAASVFVYSGGLRIYTAMDKDIQAILEEYYEKSSNFPSGDKENAFQSSMIIIDPQTGDILGVAGAIGEKEANRIQNYATQTVRPSGSVIKPISVYAPALDMGMITSASVFDDVPVEFNLKNGKYVLWPQNSPAIYRGLTNVSDAIRDSVNTVAVRVLDKVGIDTAFDLLYDRLGMRSLISESSLSDGSVITDRGIASLALGQQNYGVTVREMTGAYTALANHGEYSAPRSYYKVTDSLGTVLLSNEDDNERVFDVETADIMTLMLENVVSSGTAKAITLDKSVQVAGKTGTTQDNCDRWFIAYTPQYIGGVWCGFEYPKSLDDISGNPCLDIWDDIMGEIYRIKMDNVKRAFDLSDNIVKAKCCADSGKRLTEACRSDARGDRGVWCYFKVGSEPKDYCNCHILVEYDVVNGGIACSRCPDEDVEVVGLIKVIRNFPLQVYVSDAQYVCRSMPDDKVYSTEEGLPFFANSLPLGKYCGISRGKVQFNRGCAIHANSGYFEEE